MELVSTPWQVITTALVFIFGMLVACAASRWFQTSIGRAMLLYFWHTSFCIVYALYVNKYGGDSLHYYAAGLKADVTFSLGTAAVSYITIFFASILGLSFLGTFVAYSLFGYIGLMAFDASLRIATDNKSRFLQCAATVIVLLPSVSFWTSAIGKDALSFMSAGLILWAALKPARRTWLIVMSVLVMLLVRPHMAGIVVIALAGSYSLQPGVSLNRRLLVGGAALAACAVLVPFAIEYAGIKGGLSGEELSSYIEKRQQVNQAGGGGIDIAHMSLPMQLFTYLFRPLPFEEFNLFALAASVDNVILLSLFASGGWQILKRRTAASGANRSFLWIYVMLAWCILAMTSANLGISLRQKWMFAPMLIFLLLSAVGRPRKTAAYTVTIAPCAPPQMPAPSLPAPIPAGKHI
jgi:hypothetical protein